MRRGRFGYVIEPVRSGPISLESGRHPKES